MRSLNYRRACTVAVTLIAVATCGDSTSERIDSERRTAELVVGSAAAEWGLLTVPRAGGMADLRPLVDPDSIVWNGTTDLPVATEVWSLGEASVLLRAEDGTLLRYDPIVDDVTELATLSEEASLSGRTPSAVVFLDSAGRFAYEAGSDVAHGYSLAEPAAWAGPIEGGIAVLTTGETSRLVLWNRTDSAAVTEIPDAGRPPALVTAWGRRVVLAGPSGRVVRIYSTDEEPRLIGEAEVGGAIRAMEASPSSHEVYVALASPSRIERVSRFSFETETLAELPSAADRIRPGLFGSSLIVRTAEGPMRMRTGDDEVAALAGQWRSDLPLGLPGDLSITVVDDEARLMSVADTGGIVLAGGAPRWWIPLRFNPVAGREAGLQEALDDLGARAGAPGSDAAGETGEDTGEPRSEELDVPEVDSDDVAGEQAPAGYYAIVTSTRQRSGVESLLDSLSEGGYPTRVQSYPDEAGEVWHRGLIGPFPSRARAQAAARQLLRERDLQAWVTEIGAGE